MLCCLCSFDKLCAKCELIDGDLCGAYAQHGKRNCKSLLKCYLYYLYIGIIVTFICNYFKFLNIFKLLLESFPVLQSNQKIHRVIFIFLKFRISFLWLDSSQLYYFVISLYS